MQPELYTDMARLEADHFWFRARREVLQSCLCRHLPMGAKGLLVDAGCGTGANLQVLNRFGAVVGIDLHLPACCHAADKFPGRLLQGSLNQLPLRSGCSSAVALLDVLEHVDDQQAVLAEVFRVLVPGGSLMVTVPAFRHLWSRHDVAYQHRRRYRAGELRNELQRAGFQADYLSYFNTHLYPLITVARLLRRHGEQQSGSDMQLMSPWLNSLFYHVFRAECLWVGRWSAPFGVSLVAVAKKHGAS